MAYGLRIQFEHTDFTGMYSRIDISERDYTGASASKTLEGNEPFIPTWGDKSKILPQIYGSEAIIRFLCETDFEFIYLFTSDSKKYKVEHYTGPDEETVTLTWAGFIAPENWKEPLTAPTYIVDATAVDGLAALKNEKFPELTEGNKLTLLEIITTILDKTGLALNINTAIDYHETGQGAATDILAETLKQVESLANLNCYDLLEEIIPACIIMQRMGEWWIMSYSALRSDTITYSKYNSSGTLISSANTISVKRDAADYWIENQPELEIIPAIKQLIVIQEYGYNKSLVTNGSFTRFNAELAKFDTWTNIVITPQQGALDSDGSKYVFIPGQQYPDTYAHEGYGLITNGITKSLPVTATTSKLNLALKYALLGTAHSCLMFITVKLVGATNTYYLRRERYYETKEPLWEWINYTDKLSQGDDHICLKSHSAESAYTGITLKHPYYNTFDNVTAYPSNQITDHFEEFRASVTGIPESGEFQLFLYVPYTNRAQHAGACYTTVTLELVDETDNQYPEQKSFKIINNTDNNYTPDDTTLIIGDLPALANANIIYSHGLFRANGIAYTSAWSIPGSAGYTFAEFIGRLMAAEQATPRQRYNNMRLQGIATSLAIIIDDINQTGMRLIESGVSYDNRMSAIEGSYIELPAIDIDQFDVEVATTFDDNETTKIEIPADPKNIEERATLMDENGGKVSSPGYLYSRDFELKIFGTDPVIDDFDGFQRFQIKRAGVAPYNLDHAAGQLQFSTTSVVEANFGGNANQAKFSAGQFLIHNYNALDKDDRLTALGL